MKEYRIFNLEEKSRLLGIKRRELVLPNGAKRDVPDWKPADMPALFDLAVQAAAPHQPIALTGGGAPWLLATAVCGLGSTFQAFLGRDGAALPVSPCPMGPENPEGGIAFFLKRTGNNVEIAFDSDDPSKPATEGPHNYHLSRLPAVYVPEVVQQEDVFLSAAGAFPVMSAVFAAYVGNCRSLMVADRALDGYVCVWSQPGHRKIGDIYINPDMRPFQSKAKIFHPFLL